MTRTTFGTKQVNYSYDYENRLSAVSNQPSAVPTGLLSLTGLSSVVSYKYDYLGRRIEKNIGGTITKYIYDSDNIIAEYNGNGILVTKFIYGPNIDEPIKGLSPTGTVPERYYHFDVLGSVTDLSNTQGKQVEHYYYMPFGKTKIYNASGVKLADSAYGNYYRFTARQWDAESSLYYYRARMYDPNLGRFLQADPVGYSADINLYRYCSNNPINRTDPLGLDSNDPHKRPDESWEHYWGRMRSAQAKKLNEQRAKRSKHLADQGIVGGALRSLGYTGPLLGGEIAYAGDGTVVISNPTVSGFLNKILTGGGGALLVGIGIATDSPLIMVVGGGLVIYVGVKSIAGWMNFTDNAKSIAEDIYDETGLKIHYGEIDDLGRQIEDMNQR